MNAQPHTCAWKLLSSGKIYRLVQCYRLLPRKLGLSLALRELGGSTGTLQIRLDKLPDVSRHLEKQFLSFQDTLEKLSAASQDLITHGQAVVQMASGQDTGEVSFEAIFAVLRRPLDYLSATDAAMQELVNGLRRCLDTMHRLLDVQNTLEAILAPLQITQVMFRIEAANLPSESKQVFEAVTEKMGVLQRQVQSVFTEHARVLAELHGNLRSAVEALEERMADQGHKTLEKRNELDAYLARLLEQIQRNAQRDVALTGASQELRALVGKAIMALQMQDIIAQKLEHGRSGVREVLDAFTACTPARQNECLETVTALTRIEAAQLGAVITDLHNCDRSLHEAFGGVASLLEKLNADCIMLKEFSEITASTNGSVQGFLDSLDEIRQMIAGTLATARLAEESVSSVRDATAGLTSTVDGVAQEMRLIALNAQIQAIQRGEGTGLGVLAAHSAEVSRSVTVISTEIASKVQEVAQSVAEQSDRMHAVRTSGEAQQQQLQQASEQHEAALHQFRDRTLSEFRATGAALDTARSLGAGIVDLLELGGAIEQIGQLRASVDELHSRSAAVKRLFGSENAALDLGNVEKRYTMASERLVHATANAAAGPGTGAALDEVELWGDEPTAAASETVELWGDEPTAAASETVELWGEEPAAAVSQAVELWHDEPARAAERRPDEEGSFEPVAASSAGEFGDGAELF